VVRGAGILQEDRVFQIHEGIPGNVQPLHRRPGRVLGAEAEKFHWFKKWKKVRSYNYDVRKGPIFQKWFEGGKTNIVYNCLDGISKREATRSASSGKATSRPKTASSHINSSMKKFANSQTS